MWDQTKKIHMRETILLGKLDVEVLRWLFLPPNARHCSAFLWLLVTHNIFYRKKTATEAGNFTFLSYRKAWRVTPPQSGHLGGKGHTPALLISPGFHSFISISLKPHIA